jgi:hypothetical protein
MIEASLSGLIAAALVVMALGVVLSVHLPHRRATWISR